MPWIGSTRKKEEKKEVVIRVTREGNLFFNESSSLSLVFYNQVQGTIYFEKVGKNT